MHPAFSVLFFSTLSGAGYGLLAWTMLLLAFERPGALMGNTPLLFLGLLAAAMVLFTIGLLSSLGHLGQPQRAWRAFSQWRTSWLSREGVMAVLVYLPVLALAWWLSAPLRALLLRHLDLAGYGEFRTPRAAPAHRRGRAHRVRRAR